MRLPGLMKCELLPVLLGDLSHMWILWSWSLSRSIHLDFPLLPPACLHMAFGNLLLLRLSILCQKWNCHHKLWHHLDQGLHSAAGAQDSLIYPCVPLHEILLRIKLWCPVHSNSGSSHRAPLMVPVLTVQGVGTLTWQNANSFYNVSTCQHKCWCAAQIALPTISFSGNS